MKRTPLHRTSSDPKKRAVITLDRAVSDLVRQHYFEMGCFTCGTPEQDWRQFDCGHFCVRGNMATRWNLRNLGLQCKSDNRFKGGMTWEMGQMLDRIWGEGTASDMKRLSRLLKSWDIKELQQLTSAARIGWLVYLQLYDEITNAAPLPKAA